MYFQDKSPLVTGLEAAEGATCLDYTTFILWKQTKKPFGRRWVEFINFKVVPSWNDVTDKPDVFPTDLAHIAAGDAKTGDVITWNGLSWVAAAPTADLITSFADTPTIDLDVTGGNLTANFIGDTDDVPEGANLYFTNARAITALTGQNISIFINDVPYLVAADIANLVPYSGANQSVLLGLFALQADSLLINDTANDNTLQFLSNENLTADRRLTFNVADANRVLTISADSNISGTNTGDQTSIVGISGTKAQYNTSCSDGDFLFVGDVTQYTDEMAQDAVGAMATDGTIVYVDATPLLTRGALTGEVTALQGSNTLTLDKTSITNRTQVTVAAGDFLLIADVSDTNNLKKVLASDFLSGAGANTALSNLAAVAINTSLLAGVDDTIDLGDDTHRFHYLPFKLASGFIGWGTGGIDGAISTSGLTGNAVMNFSNASAGYDFDAGITSTNVAVDGSTIPVNGMYLPAASTLGWAVNSVSELRLSSTALFPTSDGGLALGTTTLGYNGAHFNTGTALNWENGNATITHSSGLLTSNVDIVVPDEAYGSAWNGSLEVPTKNALFDAFALRVVTGQTTADRTSTSVSLADVTDLAAFSTLASTQYYFEFNCAVTTNATTVGILLSVNHSTAVTAIRFNIMYPISATANNIQSNLTALDGGVQPTAGNGATIQFAKVWGTMTTNTAGTFALRFASETGAAVVVKAGSTGFIQIIN